MSNTDDQQNSCPQKPCQSRPLERSSDPSYGEDEIKARPVLYTGVLWIGILRRFLIPRPRIDHNDRPCVSRPEPKDVSIFTPTNTSSTRQEKFLDSPPSQVNNRDREQLKRRGMKDAKHSALASLVYQLQDVSSTVAGEAKQLSEELTELVQGGKATTSETIHTIRRKSAVIERFCAITASGLAGYMAGWRRGVVTRLVYSLTGAVAMATICYPEEARRYNSKSLQAVRHTVQLTMESMQPDPQKILGVEGKSQTKFSKCNVSDKSDHKYLNLISKQFNIVMSPPNNNTTPLEINDCEQEKSETRGKSDQILEENQMEEHSFYKDRPKSNINSNCNEEPHISQKGKLAHECRDGVMNVTADSLLLPPKPSEVHEPTKVPSSSEVQGPPRAPYTLQPNSPHKCPHSPVLNTPSQEEDPYPRSYRTYYTIPNRMPSKTSVSTGSQETENNVLNPNNSKNFNSVNDVSKGFNGPKTKVNSTTNLIQKSEKMTNSEPLTTVQQDHVKEGSFNRNLHFPISRKLSRYYVETADKSASSLNVTQDGPYHNEE